ncbi:hypothetical protein EU538_04320 [Candidatus Thorarchaeota archaeon]|nr:MAG: hypothetical protein EU538_04320 [Candidatus Thorarchaeota archaeon]
MPEEKKKAADKLLEEMKNLEDARGGKCPGCGYESTDADFFECEFCGRPICTYCHNMTNDFEFICGECISSQELTADDVQFEVDGAGRPFFEP